MKIYIDLFLIQDVIITSAVLYIVSRLTKIKVKLIRIIATSFISSFFSLILLMHFPTLYDNLLIKFLYSFILVSTCFDIKEYCNVVQCSAIAFTISIIIGGTIIFCDRKLIIGVLILVLILSYIFRYKKSIKKQLLLDATTCFVDFNYGGITYHLRSLVDNGHNVKSIYGEDVIFIKNIFLEEGGEKKNRLVIYRTISGIENSFGTKINNIKISYGSKKIICNAVIVKTLNIIDDFDAIVGLDLINEGV